MKKFSELGVKPIEKGKVWNVPTISIIDILNCEIEVCDFERVKTRFGEGRTILLIKHEDEQKKLFTSSKPIAEVIEQLNADNLPFQTTIKTRKFGVGNGSQKTYEFT